jgi:hypothetical protein
MDENNEELIERIREKCRQQRWHGPDMDNPFRFIEQVRRRRAREHEIYSSLPPGVPIPRTRVTKFWQDRNGNNYEISEDTDLSHFPLQTDFEYAPATEDQLVATEETLGCALPSLLRDVYSRLANGGFGPGYGLQGVSGGFVDLHLLDYYYETDQDSPIGLWPDISSDDDGLPVKGLFTLCQWGCGIYSVLDCSSGRVLRGEGQEAVIITATDATSLYEWLDLWAKGVDLWSRMYPKTGAN